MFCNQCGKEIEDTAKFCPHCGKEVPTPATNGQAQNYVNKVKDEAQSFSDDVKQVEKGKATSNVMSIKGTKLILSFIIGYVLSVISFLIVYSSSLMSLIVYVLIGIIVAIIAYLTAISVSNSKGIGLLIGIIGFAVGATLGGNLIEWYLILVDDSRTMFGGFVKLLPLALIWTAIIYYFSVAADKPKDESKGETDNKD